MRGLGKFMQKNFNVRNLIISAGLIIMALAFTSCNRKGPDNLINNLSDNYFTIKASFPTDRFPINTLEGSSFECRIKHEYREEYYFKCR